MKKFFTKKKVIIGSILLLFIVSGATYALITWRTKDYNIALSTKCFNINYSKGSDIEGSLSPIKEEDYLTNNTITINSKMAFSEISIELDEECADYDGLATIMLENITLGSAFTSDGESYGALKYIVAKYDPDSVDIDNLEGEELTYVKKGSIRSEDDRDLYTEYITPGEVNKYLVIVYVDLNYVGSDIREGGLSAKVGARVEQFAPTPVEDFRYSIDEYDMYDDGYTLISVPEEYVLLGKYIGDNEMVNVPATYDIDGESYKTMILSDNCGDNGTFTFIDYITNVNFAPGVEFAEFDCDDLLQNGMYYLFGEDSSLISVTGIPSTIVNINGTFGGCSSIIEAPVIPSSVTDMEYTFYGCSSLTESPVIPSSVTNMNSTFYGCSSLTEAPVIPSSVTDMGNTFSDCTSLIEVPVIPNSVTNMWGTFAGCTSLIEVPVIPSSVTDMEYTFSGCTSLSGNVKIESSNVELGWNNWSNGNAHPFYNAGSVTVEVPDGSTTYDSLNTYKPDNITLVTY